MDFSEEDPICRLCLKTFTENCTPVEVVQHILNFLTLYPNLTISDDPMMCESCAGNLTKCFDFKRRCLSIEDSISSFAEDEDKKLELRYIYSKIKLDGNIDKIPDHHSVCRLCLELVKDDASVSVRHDVDLIEILQKYFLEKDLKRLDNIVACTPCYNSLQFYASFVNNYINVEERIEEYCQVEGVDYKGQVDLTDVAKFISKSLLNVEDINSSLNIKEEEVENIDNNVDVKVKFEDPMDVELEEKLVDKEVQKENSNSFQHHPSSQSDCEQQPTRAKTAKYIRKGTDLVASYNCEICPFETKRKNYLRRHILRHRDTDAVTRGPMHKCNLCDYEATRKSNLKRHMLNHKTSGVTMYKCETCSFETRNKYYLQQHVLVHMGMIKMHKCEVCLFETKWKSSFQKHLLTHRDTPDIVAPSAMYKCDLCDYKAKRKSNLKKHMLIHKTPSDITMYKCATCRYETRHKYYLHQHMLVHRDASEVKIYKCKVCPYVSKWNSSFQRHLRTHAMYKCCLCSYEGKKKSNLKSHMLVHNTPSEIAV